MFTSVRKGGDMKKAGTIIYAVGWTTAHLWNADNSHGSDYSNCYLEMLAGPVEA